MSPQMKAVLTYMMRHLSELKYFYRCTAEACFDEAVEHYGYALPPESKKAVVKKVIKLLHKAYDERYCHI